MLFSVNQCFLEIWILFWVRHFLNLSVFFCHSILLYLVRTNWCHGYRTKDDEVWRDAEPPTLHIVSCWFFLITHYLPHLINSYVNRSWIWWVFFYRWILFQLSNVLQTANQLISTAQKETRPLVDRIRSLQALVERGQSALAIAETRMSQTSHSWCRINSRPDAVICAPIEIYFVSGRGCEVVMYLVHCAVNSGKVQYAWPRFNAKHQIWVCQGRHLRALFSSVLTFWKAKP